MDNYKYNIQFNKLCSKLELGEMISNEIPLSGGFLHRMYGIVTTKGKYAIKALNPEIMTRPTAMMNYINSEKIVNVVNKRNIPSLPALHIHGNVVHKVDNQYYLIFPWINGNSLELCSITYEHCKKIGSILADIHSIDFSELNIEKDLSNEDLVIDWSYYLYKGREHNSIWANTLNDNLEYFYYITACADNANKTLATDMVISHRDLDSKNIIWYIDNPIIIDWESAGYINPLQELTETALSLAGTETENINKEYFCAVVNSYKLKKEINTVKWKTVLESGIAGKLGWLEYNLKRSLGILCADEEEQNLGTAQVITTIKSITYYTDLIPVLEGWLKEGIINS